MCGLKLKRYHGVAAPGRVTPRVGVRIETLNQRPLYSWALSHPAWVCGLKQLSNDQDYKSQVVTPRVGVRIETQFTPGQGLQNAVTPRVGVRIETLWKLGACDCGPVTPRVGVRIETWHSRLCN